MISSRSEIRRDMRRRRRALGRRERARRSRALVHRIAHSRWFRASRRIACFFANDGEPDLAALMRLIWRTGRRCYLPVLTTANRGRMLFSPYRPDSRLSLNRYRIPEPVAARRQLLDARRLDVVLTPLVAFDLDGNRLGMGGGYYDRSFAFLHRRRHWRKPRLLGIAYQFQCVTQLPVEPWDVPLDGIATESAVHVFGRPANER